MTASNSRRAKGTETLKRPTVTMNPTASTSDCANSVTTPMSYVGDMIGDSRFSSVHSDPRFQKIPQHKSKVLVDSRFRGMLSDTGFSSSSALVDKRGRLRTDTAENPLSRYYKIVEPQEGEEEQLDEYGEAGTVDIDKGEGKREGEEEEREEEPLSSELLDDHDEFSHGDTESDAGEYDSDITDTSSDVEYGVDIEEVQLLQAENVPVIEKETHRLAVVNMDWNHVRATDIYVILSSCIPKGGHILSVSVYPSQFGINCMAEEAEHGPVGLPCNDTLDDSHDDVENEIFRNYEKKRLRYYYAVVECDSVGTADHIYKSCDGVEIERSSNVLDLRFIPNSIEFKEPPRDVATEVPEGYKCLDFHTQALQKTKINISWDEDEPHRVKALRRNFTADELADMELKEFLASDDSDTEHEEDENLPENQPGPRKGKRDIYKALLKSGGNHSSGEEGGVNEGRDMEVTFNTGLDNLSKRLLERKTKASETLWETYLRKRSEKRRLSRNRSDRSSQDEDDESDGGDADVEAPEEHDDFFVEDEPPVKKRRGCHGRVSEEDGGGVSREELELLLAADGGRGGGEPGDAVKGYNLKPKKNKEKKKKKKKNKREEEEEENEEENDNKIPAVDYSDPRFSDLFTSPLFALDPTHPQFKWSAPYARQVSQKKKGKEGRVESMEPVETEEVGRKHDREKDELSFLVKSLKSKSRRKIEKA